MFSTSTIPADAADADGVVAARGWAAAMVADLQAAGYMHPRDAIFGMSKRGPIIPAGLLALTADHELSPVARLAAAHATAVQVDQDEQPDHVARRDARRRVDAALPAAISSTNRALQQLRPWGSDPSPSQEPERVPAPITLT